MLKPLSELSRSFDDAVVFTVASSTSACAVTYATSLPIVSARAYASPAVTVSGESRRKCVATCLVSLGMKHGLSYRSFGHPVPAHVQPGIGYLSATSTPHLNFRR